MSYIELTEEEVEQVYRHRVHHFRDMGFNDINCELLATSEVDWHYAEKVTVNAWKQGYDQDFIVSLLV